jgi:hypothetical protein
VSLLIQLKFQDRQQRLAVMGQLLRQNLAPHLEMKILRATKLKTE